MQKIQLRSMVFIFFRLLIREFLIIRQDFIFMVMIPLFGIVLKAQWILRKKPYTALIGGITVIEFEDFREAKNHRQWTGNNGQLYR
mgnify:CR=1 FL=1